VVKDNVTKGKNKEFDDIDHSWTRPLAELNSIFENAGLKIVLTRKQLHFPKKNYPVGLGNYKIFLIFKGLDVRT
jgi:hypothetical protein